MRDFEFQSQFEVEYELELRRIRPTRRRCVASPAHPPRAPLPPLLDPTRTAASALLLCAVSLKSLGGGCGAESSIFRAMALPNIRPRLSANSLSAIQENYLSTKHSPLVL